PLAEPFTLGVSSSAALGAALAIVLDWGIPGIPTDWLIPANAFVFALGTLLLLQLLAQWRGAQAQTLVLFGIAIGFAAGALLSLLQFVASEDALQQLVFWNMGSLARAHWQSVAVLAVVVCVTLPFSWPSVRRQRGCPAATGVLDQGHLGACALAECGRIGSGRMRASPVRLARSASPHQLAFGRRASAGLWHRCRFAAALVACENQSAGGM